MSGAVRVLEPGRRRRAGLGWRLAGAVLAGSLLWLAIVSLIAVLYLALVAAAGGAPARARASTGAAATLELRRAIVTVDGPAWIDPLIRRLAVCESNGDPAHRAGDYGGLVSWYVGTWRLDAPAGAPREPWLAPLELQVAVAARSLARHRYFGCLRYQWVRG